MENIADGQAVLAPDAGDDTQGGRDLRVNIVMPGNASVVPGQFGVCDERLKAVAVHHAGAAVDEVELLLSPVALRHRGLGEVIMVNLERLAGVALDTDRKSTR